MSLQELKNSLVDGKTIINKALLTQILDAIISLENSESVSSAISSTYCNMHHNLGAIGEFLSKYYSKEVDEFNQLTVCMAGDSIFGRQDKGSTWNPAKPEISLTPDVNNPNETQAGYLTGHFPPNMWVQSVPYKTLELLQWSNADVKYYNHSASEVTKEGTWTDGFPLGADCTRAVYSSSNGATITLTFSEASFIKTVFHYYGAATSKGSLITIEFSEDNGATWKSATDLNLTSSLENSQEGNSYYKLPEKMYKWPNICFKGLDKNKTYKVKVTNKSTTRVGLWGFETWSKPRINVVVVAEGGNTAASQKGAPQRFYSEMYNPSLVIYELPFLNDLGSGPLASFKGIISPTSAAPSSPTELGFYYCKEDGVYTNFNNIEAKKGEYIEYNNGVWKLNSTKLESVLNTYKTNNEIVFTRLSQQGVPVIAIVTHGGAYDITRPFGYEIAIPALRGLLGTYGFAVLDIYKYQRESGYYTQNNNVIHADQTHLNDRGVQMYMDLISLLLATPIENNFAGSCNVIKRPLLGTGTAGSTIDFGFEFSKIPNVMISGGTDVIVTNVTKSGFTTTGSGDFKYIAQIL